jgi:hypothetical protein
MPRAGAKRRLGLPLACLMPVARGMTKGTGGRIFEADVIKALWAVI